MKNVVVDKHNEFIESLSDNFEKEVIAFLNTEGGNLYIGVGNDGKVLGVKDDLNKIQEDIKERIKNKILPNPIGLFDVQIINLEGVDIIKVIVASGYEKPYYLKEMGMVEDACFLRIGAFSEKMPSDMIFKLFSNRIRNNLKNIPSPKQDLTFSQLKNLYEEKDSSISDNFYKYIKALVDRGSYNYLDYLLSDKNDVSIKIAVYEGNIADDLVEIEEYGNCCLVKATYNILNKLDTLNRRFTTITPNTPSNGQEKRIINPIALREAVINAIVHTSWENELPPKFELFRDRLSITSSGGLPHNISKEEFLKGFSAPRNPEITKVFRDLGLVEQLGRGVSRILKYYDKSIFEFYPNFIRVNFPLSKAKDTYVLDEEYNFDSSKLYRRELDIINSILENPFVTQVELANEFNVSVRTIKRDFVKLLEKNIVERVGSSNDGKWLVIRKIDSIG